MASSKKIVIATHQMLYGAAQALRDYLLNKKITNLLFIGHPLVMQKESSMVFYVNGKQREKIVINREKDIWLLNYILDFILTIWWIFKQNKTYEIFVGVDGLNCIAGLFLRKIGRVKKVIFYSIDFSPVRFQNKAVNFIYHKIEKLCITLSDECWNVSPRIAEGREEFLNISPQKYKQKVVPIGIWNKQIKKLPFNKIKKHQLLFVGHLLEKQGVQKVLESIPLIVKKIPDFKFLVIGGGEYQNSLEKLSKLLAIEKYVNFLGWIKDRNILDDLMCESACAIAAYKPEKEKLYNFTYYADATKLKDYLGAGLPVILTNVPYNAKDLEKNKCGIIVKYKKEEIANQIINIMTSKTILKEYKKNALIYASKFDWNFIFDKTVSI